MQDCSTGVDKISYFEELRYNLRPVTFERERERERIVLYRVEFLVLFKISCN